MKESEFKRAYAALLRRRTSHDRSGCVQPEQLRDLIERRGPEEERLAALDHVMACPACHEEFKLLAAAARRGRGKAWLCPRRLTVL